MALERGLQPDEIYAEEQSNKCQIPTQLNNEISSGRSGLDDNNPCGMGITIATARNKRNHPKTKARPMESNPFVKGRPATYRITINK